MKNIIQKFTIFSVLTFALSVFFSSCEKDQRVPPQVEFKTGAGYFSADDTISMDSTLKVGVKATKTEDELKTFNVSVSYDGGGSETKHNQSLNSSQEDGFETDYSFTTRKQAGTENWSFTVTDRDGNITTKSLKIVVQ